jgi:hypothetical protein
LKRPIDEDPPPAFMPPSPTGIISPKKFSPLKGELQTDRTPLPVSQLPVTDLPTTMTISNSPTAVHPLPPTNTPPTNDCTGKYCVLSLQYVLYYEYVHFLLYLSKYFLTNPFF